MQKLKLFVLLFFLKNTKDYWLSFAKEIEESIIPVGLVTASIRL